MNRYPAIAAPSVSPPLSPGLVHIWHIDLPQPPAVVAALAHTLDADERARAHRFYNPMHGTHYTVAHGALRHIIAGYLDVAPAAVQWAHGHHGKPYVATPSAPWLHFSLSHSRERALVAVAAGHAVGVDLEHQRDGIEAAAIAARFFSPHEQAYIAAQPDTAAAFFGVWVCKEALYKGLGDGLHRNLASVSVLPGDAPNITWHSDPPTNAAQWSLRVLPAPASYAAALAIALPTPHIQVWQWHAPAALATPAVLPALQTNRIPSV